MRIRRMLLAPDCLQNLLVGQDLVPVLDQVFQQPEFLAGQADLHPVMHDPVVFKIDLEAILPVSGRLSLRAVSCSQPDLDPGHQFRHPERLGQVIIGAGVQRTDLFSFLGTHRQYDHRHLRPLTQPPDHLLPVKIRQAKIKDHQVRMQLCDLIDPIEPAAGLEHKERIIPRIAQTARKTFNIYVALTLACALLFWLNGMSAFDAVAHSLTTISTGGFSTHDESLAYFHSFGIELVAMVFMLLGALNFSLHYAALSGLSLRPYWHNSETRLFLKIIAVSTALITLYLFYSEPAHDLLSAARRVSFTVVSMITTTGYSIDDFSLWPAGMAMLILYVGIIGGCAGSTSGGIKVVRFLVLLKLGTREIMQLTHPHSQLSFKLDRRVIRPEILQAIMSYTSLYVATFLILILLLLASGMDMVTAYGAATTCLNNLGPGLGSVANNFASASDFQKIVLSMAMLLGRLELLTIMIIFSPAYWRR